MSLWFNKGEKGSARSLGWTMVITMGAVVLIGIVCIWYTNYEVTKSKREWCDLLTTLDVPVPADPRNPRQVIAAQQLHNIRVRFGC